MQIDNFFLKSIGIDIDNIDDETRLAALDQIVDIFTFRLGTKITDSLNEDQLDEYEKLANDSQVASEWLQNNVPNYTEIGDQVLNDLHEELKTTHQEVLGF